MHTKNSGRTQGSAEEDNLRSEDWGRGRRQDRGWCVIAICANFNSVPANAELYYVAGIAFFLSSSIPFISTYLQPLPPQPQIPRTGKKTTKENRWTESQIHEWMSINCRCLWVKIKTLSTWQLIRSSSEDMPWHVRPTIRMSFAISNPNFFVTGQDRPQFWWRISDWVWMPLNIPFNWQIVVPW